MINKIIDAISLSINAEFGDGYKIYTEDVKQGLKEPCFFIFCLNPTHELFMGKKYFRQNSFCIQFFPSSKEGNEQCNMVLERLFGCLELVSVNGDLTRGTKMKGEVVDKVLNFFINYDMFVLLVGEQITMEDLTISSDVKG